MNQIERILKLGNEGHRLRDVIDNLTDEQIMSAIEETTLAFTKWKDDNYGYQEDYLYWKSPFKLDALGKTREQLFDEWNNLKTT